MKTKTYVLTLLISVFSFSTVEAQLTILSGPEHGSYYHFVKDMSTILGDENDMEIVNKPTNGAAINYQMLMDPASPFKIAMMQMDYLNYMKTIDMRGKKANTDQVKVIVPLASEEIHLVTTESKYFKDLRDLDKAVVSIGDKNQGTYVTANFIKDRAEVFWSSRNYHFDEALKNLQLEKIDAFFFVGTAPVDKLNLSPEVMVDQLTLVPLVDFNGWAEYYEPLTISKDDYKWLKNDVPTFGVRTVLIVNESKLNDEDRAAIAKFVQALNSSLPSLKENGHIKWKEVDLGNWDNAVWPLYK